jgi:hypothetical protein
MVGWSRRNRESSERRARWRAAQDAQTLEKHDLISDIENRAWLSGLIIFGAVIIAAALLFAGLTWS